MAISRDVTTTVRRRARGAARRLRDAGTLVRTGQAPVRRSRDDDGAALEAAALAPPMFFGWTRYSAFYPNSSAFVATKNGPDEETYKRRLWSDERMQTRSRVFLDLSVPLLQRMSEHHAVRHVVSYSSDMPDPWQSQLQEAARTHDILLLQPIDQTKLHNTMRDHLIAIDSPSRTVVWYRVDDDDLLGLNYLDRLAQYATPHERDRAVSLARGYSALLHEGRITHIRSAQRRFGSQGQAYVGWWDREARRISLPRAGSHHTTDDRMPTILDSRAGVFMQLRHLGQDTATQAAGIEALRAKHLSVAPVTDVGPVLDLFPTLRDVYDPGS